jgi:predicted amidophosphoribosyltransferase
MRGWWQELTGLVLPVECAGCGRPRMELCERCRGLLGGAASVRRVRPDPEPPGLPPVYAAGRYGDEVRAVVLAHKERGALGLARPLGWALATAALRAGAAAPAALLVPVPSARSAVARRGHDATARMAVAAARELRRQGVRARAVAALRQRRPVADQALLDAAGRLANLSGAIRVAGGAGLLPAAPVVLVDDLMTTGASLLVAAQAVTAAGGRVSGAAVVAGPYRAEIHPNGCRRW